jgi:sodium/proline symporter
MPEIIAIVGYFGILFGFAKSRKRQDLTHDDFVIGNRSLNKWTTAMAAHASDMSNWLFMAYPGMIILRGGQHVWAAIGLVLIMWVNWVFIAPRIRVATERSGSVTLCGFFENQLEASWPSGRLMISIALFIFYTVYVAAILCGVGLLLQALFPISYIVGVLIGISLVLPLLLMGGYSTLAEIDLFQGLFLMGVILFVPCFIIVQSGGLSPILASIASKGISINIFDGGGTSLLRSLFLMLGWGLGYLGQPHILTKFMGIKNPADLKFSKRIGMSWQVISLFAATLVGFVGIATLQNLRDPEMVFIELVRVNFPPFVSGLFLCAIIAAIINAMSSMLLVLSTTASEDVYQRFFKKGASEKQKLRFARMACLISGLIGLGLALPNFAKINTLVEYAWSGLGATFGPLLIASLFSEKVTKQSAWVGMVTGSAVVFAWPLLGIDFPPLVVAFPLSLAAIYFTAQLTQPKQEDLA